MRLIAQFGWPTLGLCLAWELFLSQYPFVFFKILVHWLYSWTLFKCNIFYTNETIITLFHSCFYTKLFSFAHPWCSFWYKRNISFYGNALMGDLTLGRSITKSTILHWFLCKSLTLKVLDQIHSFSFVIALPTHDIIASCYTRSLQWISIYNWRRKSTTS